MEKQFILIGAVLVLAAVVLGAFGAHGLREAVSAERLGWFETAANYHMIHAIGIIVCALAATVLGPSRMFNRSCLLLLTGIIIFSGSLYIMALTDLRWLGATTPIGGIAFIAGWACFALAVKACPPRRSKY